MEPTVGLVRRWAVDWLNRGDPSACDELLAEDYTLGIGGARLDGRDAYVAATVDGLLDRFPGVGLTVHELICSGDRAAARVTEHGAAARDGGRAAWGIVTLFAADGGRLTAGWAEEDYLARRRQLAGGTPDPIEPPAAAPWATASEPPDPAAEDVVRAWLAQGDLAGADLDDGWLGHDTTLRLEGTEVEVDDLFSAGPKVAFHGVLRGRYAGGLEGVEASPPGAAPVALHLAGLVTVADGAVAGGRVVRDRLGLRRAVTHAKGAGGGGGHVAAGAGSREDLS